MSEPESREAYELKYKLNSKVEGFGLETTMVFPCPACAEPDWKSSLIVETQETLAEESICKHCSRGFKSIIKHDMPGSMSFTIVQTCGPDITAEWLQGLFKRA